MTSIEDKLLAPRPGETPEAHQARVDEVVNICRGALSGAPGHALVNLLVTAANPMRSRFPISTTSEEAAFRDGQADVVAFLILHGTNLGISRPQHP